MAFQLDLPKYESRDTQVLGVSVDVVGALKAFAEKLGVTYPMLSDFSRDTVKKYGVMDENPDSGRFRMAKRAYFIIDKQGIVRFKQLMTERGQMLPPEEVLALTDKVIGAQ